MKTHMKTTLQALVERMHPERQPMEDEEIIKWIERLPDVNKEVSTLMRMMLFGVMSNSRIKRYLGQIRKECTFLMDVLYQYPEFPERMMPLSRAVYNCLEQVMDEQERRYANYLDPCDKMPMLRYRLAAKKIEDQVSPLVSAMSTYNADKKLQAIIVGKMTVLVKQETDSRQKMSYLQTLQVKAFELCKGCPNNITVQLRLLLLRVNFNTTGFITYCKEGIDRDLAKHYDVADRYDCLLEYKLELESVTYLYKSIIFVPERPGVRDVLLTYVKAGLSCMDKKRLLCPATVAPLELDTYSRLPLAMSVDALAYFFKLLVSAGVVTGVKKVALVLFISRSFQTSGIGNANLSLQSIESKYRQVMRNTANTVKTILLKMLKQLDEEFGS